MSTKIIVQDIRALQQEVNLLIQSMLEPVRICALEQLQAALSDMPDESDQVVFLQAWLVTHDGLRESDRAVRS